MTDINQAQIKRYKPVWLAMAELWLDNKLSGAELQNMASVIVESKLTEAEIDDVFIYQLAPFLKNNHLSVAGVWTGFDEQWVIEEASKRLGRKRTIDKIMVTVGRSTYGAKAYFEQVKSIAFRSKSN